MKIRGNTLWRVPVFCMLASVVCYCLTIYLGGMFYAVKTVEADGTIQACIDPFRAMIFELVLFVAALLAGGFLIVRSMNRAEIAVSATIAVVLCLVLRGVIYVASQFAPVAVVWLLPLLEWSSELNTVLVRLIRHSGATYGISLLAPFLLVFFGKGKKDERVTGEVAGI